MWEELDAIDWAGLRHNYGSATDVPSLLRHCARPGREDPAQAAGTLANLLFHQGGWVCSAATAALPFLVRLATRSGAPTDLPARLELLDLMTDLSSEAVLVDAKWVDEGWAAAWKRALPELLGLVSAPEPEVRRAAASLAGRCGSPGALVLPTLLTHWDAEEDPATRLDLVIALGAAVGREPAGNRAAQTHGLLHELLDHPEPQLRLAAVHALAPTDPELATRHRDLVLDAVRAPSAALWRQTAGAGCGVVGVQSWTADLYPGASPAYVLGLLADHPDPEQRASALALAGGLLSRWHSPVPDLLPGIAARLADPDTEVRFRAVELIACLGPAAAAHADPVAELLDDTAARADRTGETVADAAVWALARLNDPRCVPVLAERLTGGRIGFGTGSGHSPRYVNTHWAELPGLHELLIPLRDHAEALVPAIRARLRGTDRPQLVRSLCQVLEAWGAAARTAVPDLLSLLDGEKTWTHAATALAAIGPAGGAARESLLARATAGDQDPGLAAWSYWRVGGEPGPALAVLGPAATEGRFPHPDLGRLADLGPLAAPYADRLRSMVAEADDDWVRVRAAHALWAIAGDTDPAVPVLLAVCRPLTRGAYLPVMLPAVHHLTRIGPAARPAATVLAEALTRDDRLSTSAGWRAFVDDETIRAAVTALVTATTPPAAPVPTRNGVSGEKIRSESVRRVDPRARRSTWD
ncbi:HEAT repeat domain-containing protein [Kitasatospora sp. NPDC056531]|uniref:HEAT repeat domain-containing protein n=1 Tax=Kitasatospora sp. NPDC056531 TaxID=3345856 RepID=UPI003693DE03